MKNVSKFLLLFVVFALMGSTTSVMAQPKDIPSILGEYIGEVQVSGALIPDQTFYEVKMELKESNPDYAIKVTEIDVGGGIYLPEYELDKVVITQSGNGYKLTRSGSLNIIIDEIVIPGLGTFTNVPVAITLEDGYVEDNVLTLSIKAVATVVIVIVPIPITINVGFEGTLLLPDCDPVTNAEAQIENCEKATINWTSVTGAKEYEIKRDGVAPVTITAPPYIENFDFEHGKSYTWKIKTICEQNEASEVSISATADCEICNPVTNAEAQIENCEMATITWNVVAGAKEYKIVRDGVEPVTVTDPPYIEDFDFEHGQSYIWTIITICENTESTEVCVSATADCDTPSVNELAAGVAVYPNPTSGEIVVSSEYRVQSIEIFDVMGKKVSHLTISHPISISHLPTGVYFLRITTENGTVTRKVVKQ